MFDELEQLPPKVALAMALEAKAKLLSERKLFSYFPDTGPLRRELYKKHMQFFRLGATCSIRCFLAANRVGKCITENSKVDTPNGAVRVRDLRHGDSVYAWDGEKKVAQSIIEPFCKPGLHDCALIVMSDGRTIEVADHHRILFSDGWRLLSECLPESFFDHPLSNLEPGQLTRVLSVLSSFGIPLDYQDDCLLGCRPYGVQLHSSKGIGLTSSPLQDDVQQHSVASLHSDDLESKCNDTLLTSAPHPSILDVARHALGRFAGFLVSKSCTFDSPSLLKRPTSSLLRVVATVALRLAQGVASQALQFGSLKKMAFDTPDVDGNSIVAVIPIGRHRVYDFTVPKYHNYCAAGLVHHNTESGGGYEMALHLTGRYPDWWEGARFDAPIRAWAAGDTSKTVRDILQLKLCGPWTRLGTGLIPAEDIVGKTPKIGVSEAIDTITVKHYDAAGNHDGDSILQFKSYDQGREVFQGTEQDVIWLDEESNEAIRSECILRLMTTMGILIETFTPLRGLTPIVMQYLPDGEAVESVVVSEDRALVMAGWDDVPHLNEQQKKIMLANTPPFLRDARSKGIPSLGAGAIYPVQESEIVVDDFAIPPHWVRLYALDVGWNRTAALWGAWDRDSDIIYLYSEHYKGQAEPSIHADSVKARGMIQGVIDPAARGRGQRDGEQLFKNYKDLGLQLLLAVNGVESGIYDVWQRLSTGRLKVFKSLSNFKTEYRIYRRDEKGHVVKENDHLMDCMRYLVAADAKEWKLRDWNKPKVMRGAERGVYDEGMGY